MKITRYKRVQRYLSFYKNNFAFRTPYQILIDATFCQIALNNQVNIRDQLPKYLNGEVKLMTTVCVVNEIEKIGSALYGAMLIVKQFNVRRCGHEKHPISASKCLLSMVKENNNSEHYCVATQDFQLKDELRHIPGCPLLYLLGNCVVMEKPSHLSSKVAEEECERQLALPSHQMQVLKQLKRKELGIKDEDERSKLKKRRKGPKGPNPLSCKKKKKKETSDLKKKNDEAESNSSKGRKRKRNKMPKHIKRLLGKIESDN